MLLSRDAFREGVFKRDAGKCVMCDKGAIDAHHIIERRLFSDGGYYLNNGASLCGEHHMEAEMTVLSVEDIREACGINHPLLPEHFYSDLIYDKWGNIIQPDGTRLRGDLFYDESVQKILKQGGVLQDFVKYVKYPRTYHLPWSPGLHDDDRMMPNMQAFQDQEVLIMEKTDGENTTMYSDHIHARSLTSGPHESRDWVKGLWSRIMGDIPEGWRICGENMFAKHSIAYENLPSYFLAFAIWDDTNTCLGWDQTMEWFNLLGLVTPKILYKGIYKDVILRDIEKSLDFKTVEGYIIRTCEPIKYSEFRYKVGKYVRKDHIQTVKHWMYGQKIEKNKLKE